MNPTKIIILSSNRMVQRTMERQLVALTGIQVMANLDRVQPLHKVIGADQPDVILADMEDLDGWEFEMVRKIRFQFPAVRVISMVYCFYEVDLLFQINHGVHSFIAKDIIGPEVGNVIRETHRKGYHYTPELSAALTMEVMVGKSTNRDLPLKEVLKTRESQVLDLLSQGLNNQQIAKFIGISPRTVEGYKAKIRRNLQVNNMAQAVLKGVQLGIISV